MPVEALAEFRRAGGREAVMGKNQNVYVNVSSFVQHQGQGNFYNSGGFDNRSSNSQGLSSADPLPITTNPVTAVSLLYPWMSSHTVGASFGPNSSNPSLFSYSTSMSSRSQSNAPQGEKEKEKDVSKQRRKEERRRHRAQQQELHQMKMKESELTGDRVQLLDEADEIGNQRPLPGQLQWADVDDDDFKSSDENSSNEALEVPKVQPVEVTVEKDVKPAVVETETKVKEVVTAPPVELLVVEESKEEKPKKTVKKKKKGKKIGEEEGEKVEEGEDGKKVKKKKKKVVKKVVKKQKEEENEGAATSVAQTSAPGEDGDNFAEPILPHPFPSFSFGMNNNSYGQNNQGSLMFPTLSDPDSSFPSIFPSFEGGIQFSNFPLTFSFQTSEAGVGNDQ
jgi:hypothetical protein